jgi:hypothetical protein
MGTWVATGYWMVRCDRYAISAIRIHSIGMSQWIVISKGIGAVLEEVCSIVKLIVGADYSCHAYESIGCSLSLHGWTGS